MESRKNNTIGLANIAIAKGCGNIKLGLSARGIEPFSINYLINLQDDLRHKALEDAVSKFRSELDSHLKDICSSEYQYTLKKLRMNKFLDKYLEVAANDLTSSSVMGVTI